MDKQKIVSIPTLLDCQLNILSVFYSDNKTVSVQELTALVGGLDETIIAVLTDLVAYGIVTAHFDTNSKLKYRLTLFGQYFCNKILCKQDTDGQTISEENDI